MFQRHLSSLAVPNFSFMSFLLRLNLLTSDILGLLWSHVGVTFEHVLSSFPLIVQGVYTIKHYLCNACESSPVPTFGLFIFISGGKCYLNCHKYSFELPDMILLTSEPPLAITAAH